MATKALIRIRTPAGVWRIRDVDLSSTVSSFLSRVEEEQKISIKKISLNPGLNPELNKQKTLKQLGLKNGSMLHVEVGKGVITVGGTRREVDEEGNLVSSNDKRSFLPGLQALGDQKRDWTLTEMTELEKKFQFTLRGDKRDLCSRASLDSSACQSFVKYMVSNLQMKQCRCGVLIGKYVDSDIEKERKDKDRKIEERNAKFKGAYGSTAANMNLKDLDPLLKQENAAKQGVMVEAIYEPSQEGTAKTFSLKEIVMESNAVKVAKGLGLDVVGFIVSHPNSEFFKEVNLAANEVIHAAEISIESTSGERFSPFVVVSATEDEQRNIHFEAYSLTGSCLDMVAEGALAEMEDTSSHCSIVSPFSAIIEAKLAHVVDTDFFIKSVPIVNHDSVFSENATQEFPRLNRPLTSAPSASTARNFVKSRIGSKRNLSDEDIAKLFSNFHLLLYFANILGTDSGIEEVTAWVKKYVFEGDKSTSFPEGYKFLLQNSLGLD